MCCRRPHPVIRHSCNVGGAEGGQGCLGFPSSSCPHFRRPWMSVDPPSRHPGQCCCRGWGHGHPGMFSSTGGGRHAQGSVRHVKRKLMVCSLAAGWGWGQLVTFTETTPSSPIGVKVAQSCPTLCDPMDYTDHGVLQSRTLERAAVPP